MSGRSEIAAWALLVFSVLAAASNVAVSAWLVEVPPLTLACGRWVMTGLLLSPWLLARPSPLRHLLASSRFFWGLAALGPATMTAAIAVGVRMAPSSLVAVINATLPFWIVAWGRGLYRDPMRPGQKYGLAVAMVGVLGALVPNVSADTLTGAGAREAAGCLLVLAAMAAYGYYSAQLRRLPPGLSGLSMMSLLAPLAALELLPLALVEQGQGGPHAWTARSLLALLYLGLVPSALAYAAWIAGVLRVGSTSAAITFALLPPFTAWLSWILQGARPTSADVFGSLLVAVGLALSARSLPKASVGSREEVRKVG